MNLKKINELFNFEKGVLQSTKCEDGAYDFITAAAEWKKNKEYSHNCEALIFAAAASGSLGRTHYVNGKFISSDLCFILTPNDSKNFPVDLQFYHIIFNLYKNDIVAATKAGTSKEAIGLKVFGEYKLPYFEMSLQRKVKADFGDAESLKNKLFNEYNFQLTQISNLNQAILQEAVQGKLVKQDPKDEPASELLKRIKAEKAKSGKKEKPLPPIKPEEIPFEIPESWVWCRLGEICDNITKGSSPNWQGVEYVSENDGILFITSKNVDSFKIDLTKATYVEEKFNKIEPRSILRKGDILTNIVGASIGRTALFDLDVVANINQAVCILRIEHNLINKDYLLNLMNSNLALKLMTDSSFAPGRANLSMGNISNFPIPLPPYFEQKRIVAEIEKQIAKTKQIQEHITANQQATEQLLKALLHQAFEVEETQEV